MRTDNEFYVFYPFGPRLSKGFATLDVSEIEKAIAREKRMTVMGLKHEALPCSLRCKDF